MIHNVAQMDKKWKREARKYEWYAEKMRIFSSNIGKREIMGWGGKN